MKKDLIVDSNLIPMRDMMKLSNATRLCQSWTSFRRKSVPGSVSARDKARRTWPGWAGIALVLSITTPLFAGERYYIAHRGEYMALENGKGVVDAPEGTRPAFERVRDRKVNAVKLDLHYTADHIVVISHDPNLKRTTGKDLPIAKTTYEDLKKAPFLKAGSFENERILTLDEALKILKDCPLYYVDFKYHTPEMMTTAFETFESNGIPRERIILATFTQEALRDAQRRYPEVRRVLHIHYAKEKDGTFLLNGKTRCADFGAVAAQMAAWKKEMGLYGYNLPTSSPFTTLEFIRQLKAEGNWLSLWYIHSTKMADKFKDSEVDGFVTGMPSAVRKALNGN